MLTHIHDFLFINFDEVLYISASGATDVPYVEIKFINNTYLSYEKNLENEELIRQLFIKASEHAKKSPD